MKRRFVIAIFCTVVVGVGTLLVWSFHEHRKLQTEILQARVVEFPLDMSNFIGADIQDITAYNQAEDRIKLDIEKISEAAWTGYQKENASRLEIAVETISACRRKFLNVASEETTIGETKCFENQRITMSKAFDELNSK